MFLPRGRTALYACLFLFPALAWGEPQGNNVAAWLRDRWQEANEAYQKGDYDRSATITAELLKLHPDDADALILEWQIVNGKKALKSVAKQLPSDDALTQLKQEAKKIAAEHAKEKKEAIAEEKQQKQWQAREKEGIQRRHLERGKKFLKKGEL